MTSKKLERLRKQIDAIDDRLVQDLIERIRLAREIGAVKRTSGQAVPDREREAEIVRRLTQAYPTLKAESIRELYELIFHLCRSVQREEG